MIFGVPDFDTGLSTAVYSHLLTCSSEAVQEPEAGVKAMETCLIELYLVFGSFFFVFTHPGFVTRLHACCTTPPQKYLYSHVQNQLELF